METSMSMPILASAVARRPHLFVDVRESSRVHSVASLRAVIDYFSRKPFDPKSFVWSTNSKRVRASVNRGKDKLESIH